MSSSNVRQLPAGPGEEEQILGAVLDAGRNARRLVELSGLGAKAFTNPRVRVAWRIVQQLAADGARVEASSVYAAGVKRQAFQRAEDLAWLQTLEQRNAISPDGFAALCGAVRGRIEHRVLQQALSEAAKALSTEGVAAARKRMAEALEAPATDVETRDLADLAQQFIVDWYSPELARQAQHRRQPTHIRLLDELIGGWPVNLSVVAGLPGTGKSALLGSCLRAHAAAGETVGVLSLEDGWSWAVRRMLGQLLGLDSWRVGAPGTAPQDAQAIDTQQAWVNALRGRIRVSDRQGLSVAQARATMAAMVLQGCQVLYIDHGGELDYSETGDRADDFRLRIAEGYRQLRDFALSYATPVVVLAHTRRPQDDHRERAPRASDLAESAYIERRARLMLGVWTRAVDGDDFVRLTVTKHTDGPAGITVRLPRAKRFGLLELAQGEIVNLREEAAAELRAKAAEKAAQKAAQKAERQEAKPKRKKPAQSDLLSARGEAGTSEGESEDA